MGAQWGGLIGALAGTIVGGIVTHFVENARFKRQRYEDWNHLRRSKLEEIGEVAEALRLSFAAVTIAARAWAVGEREGLEALKKVTPPISRLAVLVRFYAAELEPAFQAILAAEMQMNEEILKFSAIRKSSDREANLRAIAPLVSAQQEADRRCRDLVVALSPVAGALVPGKP